MLVRRWLTAAAIMLMPIGLPAHAQEDDAALIARGEYLARAADCMPCHTSPGGKPYAGGLGLSTPFGTLYSVNITSDRKTGIGGWTFEQFTGALHDGIRADGAFLYPAMPFDAYTGITEDDLRALWAYVRRIPAVEAANPDNQLSFPFSIRLGMLAWRELYFTPQSFQPTPGKSDVWNRGAYLVEALGHCSDCHSPRNVMGAIKGKEQFVGAEVDGFYAPDIASAALAKTWRPADLKNFLKTGSAPDRTSVFGPMADVVQHSLAHLTDADLDAMVTYLLDSPPPADLPAPQKLSPLPAETYHRAAKLYVDQCAGCHQPHGTGLANSVPPLQDNPAVTATEPYNVLKAVLDGLPPGGRYGAMPSFAGRLSDQQIAELANYVRTSWGNQAPANATASMVGLWRSAGAVPDYGTSAAEDFQCPQVGGAPGAPGPDANAVAALAAMIQGGNRHVPELIATYQKQASDTGTATTIDALLAAYCPTVAQADEPAYIKKAELERFAMQAAADLSQQTATVPFPAIDLTLALPVGHSLVAREPDGAARPVACPADDGKLVAASLVADARQVLGTPALPVTAEARDGFVTALKAKDPKTVLADIANALIVAYCEQVVADGAADEAERRTWLETFSREVIQHLQMISTRSG